MTKSNMQLSSLRSRTTRSASRTSCIPQRSLRASTLVDHFSLRCRFAKKLCFILQDWAEAWTVYFFQVFSGRDASQAFISYHRRNFPHNRARPALEGLDDTVNYTPDDHTDFMELCERVNKVLPRLKSFAPWHYYIKCAYLICAFLFMEMYCHYNNFYNLPIGITMGFHMALIGNVTDEVKSIFRVGKFFFLRPQYSTWCESWCHK